MARTSSSSRVIYRGRKINLALKRVPAGDHQVVDCELVLHPGAVALLPLVDQDHLCLIKNERYAVDKTLIEVPAGTIDAGESPHQTATRELTEETGYTARRIELIRSWFVSPGVMNERMFLFLCQDLTPGTQRLQPDERLETLIVPWREAVTMALDGQIEDAKTILALLLFDRLQRQALQGG